MRVPAAVRSRVYTRCIDDFHTFLRCAWPEISPNKSFVDVWHAGAVCRFLQDFWFSDDDEALVCIPPRHYKSTIVGAWNAWLWLQDSSIEFAQFGHKDPLPIRDSRWVRRLVESSWYRKLQAFADSQFDVRRGHQGGQDRAKAFDLTSGGRRHNFGIREGIIGFGADVAVIDDPYDAKQALRGSPYQVRQRMDAGVSFYDGQLVDRMNAGGPNKRLVVMQRLHRLDLAGVQWRRGVKAIVLPTLFVPGMRVDGREVDQHLDRRTEPGELLYPTLKGSPERTRKWIDLYRERDPVAFRAKHQQGPQTSDAAMIQVGKWRTYHEHPAERARNAHELVLSVDAGDKTGARNDPTSMGVWARRVDAAGQTVDGSKIDMETRRMEFPELLRAFKALRNKWRPFGLSYCYVEDAANGRALLQLYRDDPLVVGVSPQRPLKDDPAFEDDPRSGISMDKITRATFYQSATDRGLVSVPRDEVAPWLCEDRNECRDFPGGDHDDRVDQGSQVWVRWLPVEPPEVDAEAMYEQLLGFA